MMSRPDESEGPSQYVLLESMVWSHCLLHNDTDGGSALTSQMTLCINASDQRSLRRFLFVFTSSFFNPTLSCKKTPAVSWEKKKRKKE